MYQIKFNNLDVLYDINMYRIKDNVITIKGDGIPTDNTSGFLLLENNKVIKDFSNYTTKYNVLSEIGSGVMFSCDGSTETELNRINSQNSVNTEEILLQVKKDKINESKNELYNYLETHPLCSSCHGGKEGIYNVTKEKQDLMSTQYTSYLVEKQVYGTAKLTWNESGKSCEEWTEEEFVQLILEIKEYVYPLVAKQQSYEEQIKNCTTLDEVESIYVCY